jgi:hypothetical protein
MEDGVTIEMLSIGMVCEDGRELYACRRDVNHEDANDWVKANVLPHLDPAEDAWWPNQEQLANGLITFVADGGGKPEFWAYYADYDWVALCQVFGTMMDLPKGWPMYCRDVKQLCDDLGNPKLPEQTSTEHNSLFDARWTRDSHLWLVGDER